MNLGKLLGTGKSFIGGGKPASYRTDKRVYLPQFISPKNPFADPAKAPPAELPVPPNKNSSVAADKSVPCRAKTQKIPVVAAQGATARATTWVSKMNAASLFRAALPGAIKNATPVQAELSLEKVKVVHNDLTDAEVEIVPMKSRPAREPATDAQPPKKSWADLGQRIMKATAL